MGSNIELWSTPTLRVLGKEKESTKRQIKNGR